MPVLFNYVRWYLALNRRNEEYDDTICLEAPMHPAELEQRLSAHGLAAHELMREFCTHFAGLRSQPLHAGNFERPEEWATLRDIRWDEEDFYPEYRTVGREWLDGLLVHTTSTGDMVVRNADDRVAWVLIAENRVTPIAPSFAGFLDLCAEAYDRQLHLDYYQSREIWSENHGELTQ